MISLFVFGYLDPNSGSILLQALLAGLLGIGVIVRMFWSKIKGILGMNRNQPGTEGEVDQSDEPGD